MAFTNSQGRTQSSLSDINITPFVDVVLVLLIIFMLTAPIIQSGIEVDVPHTTTVKQITEQRLVLTMDRNQNVFLGDKPVNLHELPSILKEQVKDPQHHPIYLRCDEDATFGAFAALMDAVKLSGITNISIVTQPYQQTKNAAR
ncbi:MAG TPA: biopolymer transporter ExbD [Terriglobales bacterium]|nr:biopolymer transporter ExbD [Terriglobales bacterium]